MFPNQISSRDLISGSYSQSGDSGRDFSQLQSAQFTQFDMSQTESQDFYSQSNQLSNGSNQETQGRRMSTYEKYMSKPLFGNNSQGQATGRTNSSQPKPRTSTTTNPKSFQQQMSNFKARAKEKEERDMLSSIVTIVQECSDEVKQNLNSLKETEQDTGDVLTKAVDKLSSTVEESSDRILKAILAKEELSKQNSNLQQQLQKKDEKIQELLQQSSESSVKDNLKTMQEAMESFLEAQHSATEHKLQKILDTAKDQLNMIQEIESCQKSDREDSKKHQTDWKYTSLRQLQDMEKRLQNEFTNMRDDFDRQKRDMESFCKNQVQSFHQKYARDIEQHIYRGLEKSSSIARECTQDFCRQQQSEIKDILQEQNKEMESSLIFQNSKQSDKLLKQSQDQSLKSCKDIKKQITGKLDIIQTQQQQLMDDNDKQFKQLREAIQTSDTERPWLNDNFPKHVQDQLNRLHDDHKAEIRRLENEIEQSKRKRETSNENRKTDTVECANLLENVYDFTVEESNRKRHSATDYKSGGSMFGSEPTFLSPRPQKGTTWTSKSLFGRANPSPVATVLPQRKPVTDNQTGQISRQNDTNQIQDQTNQNEILPARQLRSKKYTTEIGHTNEGVRLTNKVFDDVREEINIAQNETYGDQVLNRSTKKRSHKKRNSKGEKIKGKVQATRIESNPIGMKNKAALSSGSSENNVPEKLRCHNNIGKIQPVAPINPQPSSLYDFHDDTPPRQSQGRDTRKPYQVQPYLSRNYSVARPEILMSPDSGSSDIGSSNSSPSLSVTEVFIRRRIRHDVKTPMVKDTQTELGLPDFLSTPNLTELFTDRNVQRMGNVQTQKSAAVRRHAERRKLCDFDTEVIQTIQCSNKRSRHGKI